MKAITLNLAVTALWLHGIDAQVGNATETPFPSLNATFIPISLPTNTSEPPELTIVGENGQPPEAYPLAKCDGDCNDDADCQDGLICFQRDVGRTYTVPGCLGETDPTTSTDFCFDPLDIPEGELVIVGNNSVPAALFPLQKCQGDCDNDSDCVDGLVCFQRGTQPTVPGCIGTADIPEIDYCADPAELATPTPEVTDAPTPQPVDGGSSAAPTLAGDESPAPTLVGDESPAPTVPTSEPPVGTPPNPAPKATKGPKVPKATKPPKEPKEEPKAPKLPKGMDNDGGKGKGIGGMGSKGVANGMGKGDSEGMGMGMGDSEGKGKEGKGDSEKGKGIKGGSGKGTKGKGDSDGKGKEGNGGGGKGMGGSGKRTLRHV
jgi:hypothetical protein